MHRGTLFLECAFDVGAGDWGTVGQAAAFVANEIDENGAPDELVLDQVDAELCRAVDAHAFQGKSVVETPAVVRMGEGVPLA